MGKMEKFLALYPNDNTFRNYRAGLMAFADWKYGPQRKGREASKGELTRYDQVIDEYLASGPEYLQDFIRYAAAAASANTAPHTARNRFVIWKEFLAEQGIEIKTRDLKRIRTKLTTSPGSGYVQRGTSITGAPLFTVGPWTQAGVYRLDGYDYSIWRNPIGGALDVATIPGQGSSLSDFRTWNPGGEVILW